MHVAAQYSPACSFNYFMCTPRHAIHTDSFKRLSLLVSCLLHALRIFCKLELVRARTRTNAYTHARTHTHTHTHIHTHIHTCTYTHTYLHTHTCPPITCSAPRARGKWQTRCSWRRRSIWSRPPSRSPRRRTSCVWLQRSARPTVQCKNEGSGCCNQALSCSSSFGSNCNVRRVFAVLSARGVAEARQYHGEPKSGSVALIFVYQCRLKGGYNVLTCLIEYQGFKVYAKRSASSEA